MPDTFDTEANLIGAVGTGATAHIHGFTPEQVTELVRTVIASLLAADPVAIARNAQGHVQVGDTAVTLEEAEALARLPAHLSAGTPAEARHGLAVAARMVSPDVVPPADFAARAREYVQRQHTRLGPLAQAEEEEAVYVPLKLRFSRAVRPGQDDLFLKEPQTFDDIRVAVDAPDPQASPPRPFPAMVLLGDPGSGKSTSVRHLALVLLQAALSDPASAPLPLLVNLGDHRSGSPGDFLAEQWAQWYGAGDLPAVMEHGRLWLLADGLNEILADDERDYEARVKDWRLFLHDRRQFLPGNRALVACRSADYGNGLDLPRLHLEPMDDRRVADFVAARFHDTPQRGQRLLEALQDDRQVHGVEHGLHGLVRNPFWLVMLADVFLEGDQLPRNRAALVQDFVDRWLAHEADRLPGQVLTPRERAALQMALDALAFAHLTRGQNTPQPRAWAKDQLPTELEVGGERVSLRSETVLKLAEAACLLECRGRPEACRVRFYHQLLLEHFAGRELLRRFQGDSASPLDSAPLWRIPWVEKWQFVESAWDPLAPPPTTGWEEATVLAAAQAALPDPGAEENEAWPRLALAVLAHNPPLAARCLLEAGVSPLPELARRPIIERLLAFIADDHETPDLDPRQRLSLRIAYGRALGHLDDPRILAGERRTSEGVRFILPQWSRVIPAGPFPMGSSRDDPDTYQDEYSQATGYQPHAVDIPYDYVVGRYPVTNAEYACFVRDEGYHKEQYWRTENARAWLRGELDLSGPWVKRWREIAEWVRTDQIDPDELLAQRRISPDTADAYKWAAQASDEELEATVRRWYGAAGEQTTQPRYWDDARYNNPSQPVVGVCWFEAMAYCAWLGEQISKSANQPTSAPSQVRLPSEAEWEKAARWDGAVARRYPWGEGWDAAQANTLEGRVLTTSPVGTYPGAASPCGALDVAGNVWEWTRSRWGPEVGSPDFGYPYQPDDGREDEESSDLRVVRGGSWLNEARDARAAYRSGDNPDFRYDDLGFRLALRLS